MRTAYIPVIERAELVREEQGDVVRVWYRVSSPGDARRVLLQPGEWVVLLARVHSARASGGYKTGEKPPGAEEALPVEKHPVIGGLEFRFEQAEIYWLPQGKEPDLG